MATHPDTIADYLVDRRALRRKLTFWRVAAILALVLAVGVAGYRFFGARGPSSFQTHIARIAIEGLITGDRDTLRLIRNVSDSNAVAAVILSIESPGGTTTGSEKLYNELRRLSARKPVVAVVGNMAASGAYIAALGSDHIVASGNSLVGSIGVLFQFPNVSKLMDTVGVHMEEVKSSPLKAAPNGYEPTSPEARAALAALVSDSFDWFKALVRDRRQISATELAAVADGRVFTGRQGLPLKLVDEVGEERDAIAWLEKEKHVAARLPVRDWKADRSLERLGLLGMAAQFANVLGFSKISNVLAQAGAYQETAILDGLLAVWHQSAAD